MTIFWKFIWISFNWFLIAGYFAEYAETLDQESANCLSTAASDNKVHVIGGSFPEKKDGKLFNTCTVWGPKGDLLAVHRKVWNNREWIMKLVKFELWVLFHPVDAFIWYWYSWQNQIPGVGNSEPWKRTDDFPIRGILSSRHWNMLWHAFCRNGSALCKKR